MFAVTTNAGRIGGELDVCGTPSAGGTTPVVYANTTSPAQGRPKAQKLLVAGMPALHQNSSCGPSAGNEQGVAGGVVSGEVKGAASFSTGSGKVMIEGSPAVRLNDAAVLNGGNGAGRVLEPSQGKVMILS
ncbi:DUF4150 domain-containing protein [Desulfonatronum sp. SC1]|uniref:DUF4150 domain-containing protein n=1 Tax=Desulfonatronum sp. SC1 TaxID=2109626 RepID=UPI000D31D689|nr:DUF4150 domain-containing protein [Desulfonatronum sp. SC1]PTN37182.1 type VI secretion protein [Desulfonatronum sp. SC1]